MADGKQLLEFGDEVNKRGEQLAQLQARNRALVDALEAAERVSTGNTGYVRRLDAITEICLTALTQSAEEQP